MKAWNKENPGLLSDIEALASSTMATRCGGRPQKRCAFQGSFPVSDCLVVWSTVGTSMIRIEL